MTTTTEAAPGPPPAKSNDGAPNDRPAAEGPRKPSLFRRVLRRLGAQGARITPLVAIVAISGMAVGYALGYPLRFVDYSPSSSILLDQASFAGAVDVNAALVTAEDLDTGWQPGDSALGGFGVLGADVCGEPVETPTPLSSKLAAVYTNPANDTTVIAQALRVDLWKSAQEYVDDVRDGLEDCDTFFRAEGEERVKVTNKAVDREGPITDHLARTYTSASGVQEWSMMSVGDVIIAIQYLGPTPPPKDFLPDVEKAVLARVAPAEFAGAAGSAPAEADPTATTAPADQQGGAADETGDTSGAPAETGDPGEG